MLFSHKKYLEDVQLIAHMPLPWDTLKNKSILITGATGLINSFLIDVLMYRNTEYNNKITIYPVGRSTYKLEYMFTSYINNTLFIPIEWDINNEVPQSLNNYSIDYIINAASTTHPVAYAKEPISTILTNIIGLNNILSLAVNKNSERVLILSTIEIYGNNIVGVDSFHEDFSGYINCNTLRAGYPESKRTAEALCQAYRTEYDQDIVIARPSRVYGPTMGKDDSKATAQFIKAGLSGQDIVLKSEGIQQYSYCYMADVASALLFLLFNGTDGEAYNIADDNSKILLKNLAGYVATKCNTNVVFDLPNNIEKAGFSNTNSGVLDSSKIKSLGWNAMTSIKAGIDKTIDILK